MKKYLVYEQTKWKTVKWRKLIITGQDELLSQTKSMRENLFLATVSRMFVHDCTKHDLPLPFPLPSPEFNCLEKKNQFKYFK